MEDSSPSVGPQYHVRSISLPSRLHPNTTKLESQLNKLKTSFSSLFPIGPDTIQNGLVELAELYGTIEELMQSPCTQKAFLQHQNGALVEDALEGPIRLLDSCLSLKDLLSLMKGKVQELQSSLRRKGGDFSIGTPVAVYFSSRKKVEKITAKCLKVLKQIENKSRSSISLDVNQHLSMVIRVLRDLEIITISVFRSVLLFLSVPCLERKGSGRWSMISKLVTKSSTACERNEVTGNEVESVDLALRSTNNIYVDTTQKRLGSLDARIEGFEAGLERVFRRLIRSRVSLLNTLAS